MALLLQAKQDAAHVVSNELAEFGEEEFVSLVARGELVEEFVSGEEFSQDVDQAGRGAGHGRIIRRLRGGFMRGALACCSIL